MRSVKRLQRAALVSTHTTRLFTLLIYTAIAKNKLCCRGQGSIMTIIDDDDDDAESLELVVSRSISTGKQPPNESTITSELRAWGFSLWEHWYYYYTCDLYFDIPEPTNNGRWCSYYLSRGTPHTIIFNVFLNRETLLCLIGAKYRLHMRFSFSHVMTFVV